MQGDDLQLNGDLACQNAEIRGEIRLRGALLIPGLIIEDEGAPIVGNPHTRMNFVGAGVTATDAGGGAVNVTIPGAAVGVNIEDEGAPIAGNPHTVLNFLGGGVTATDAGAGVANINIPAGITGIDVENEGAPIAGGPHQIFNFVGVGVTATDAGGGVADIAIPGGVAGIGIADEGAPIAGNPHAVLNFLGGGVTATDAGAGVADVLIRPSSLLFWGNANISPLADTRFLNPGREDATPAPLVDLARIPVSFTTGAAIKNLFVSHQSAVGNGNSVTYTVLVNGLLTGMTVTLATGAVGQAGDVLNGAVLVQGDRVSLQAVKPLAIGSGMINVQATIEVSQV